MSAPIWEEDFAIAMFLESIADAPRFALPQGFLLRAYKSGDASHWLRLHQEADQHNQFWKTTFLSQFTAHWQELPLRQLYVEREGEVIATASAWSGNSFWREPSGRVHWVAVAPGFQSKGIGKALVTATLERLENLGETRAYLTTSTIRPAAIKVYLDCGFKPALRSADELSIWSALKQAPRLQALLEPLLERLT